MSNEGFIQHQKTNEQAASMIRPAMAGKSGFYPTDPKVLREMIDHYLERVKPANIEGSVKALVCPHAGYVYSGQIAATAFSTLIGRYFDTVVIIGPSHYASIPGAAASLADAFATPLGDVPVDKDMTKQLIDIVEGVKDMSEAHLQEHSIEVQLPWLQVVLSGFKIVTLAVNTTSLEFINRLASGLSTIVSGQKKVLIVVSTDLSHYHPYDAAVAMDRRAIDAILSFQPDVFNELYSNGRIELCGGAATQVLISTFSGREDVEIEFLGYQNSGDITGDRAQVVGYGALVVHEPQSEMLQDRLSADEKRQLLELARVSIKSVLSGEELSSLSELEGHLKEKRGAFVTLKKNGQLRGCIGYTEPIYTLGETVKRAAIAAAMEDPRFPTLTSDELNTVSIEISVLTPLKEVSTVEEIEVGKHGIVIEKGPYKGLLLPQVAVEQGCTREEFIDHTCLKAGLMPGAWKEPGTKLYSFSAEVFGED